MTRPTLQQKTAAPLSSGAAALGARKALLAVVLLNAIFLLLSLYGASLPSAKIASTARHAFETGALTDSEYIQRDSERGHHQYNDCLIIQLIVNDVSLLDDALAPLVKGNMSWSVSCSALRSILFGGIIVDEDVILYTKYWHGYVPIAASLLSVLSLEHTRTILKFLVYCSLLVLALSASRAPAQIKIFALSVAGIAALFWALPYFGQSLCHAPGDAFLMLGLALFLFNREQMLGWDVLLPSCAVYGAAVAYLEFWTGQLPTAAGFLFVAAYLINVTRYPNGKGLLAAWRFALGSLLAFTGGAGLTVALKQLLAVLLTDAPALSSFVAHLSTWSSGAYTSETSAPGVWHWALGRLSGLFPLFLSSSTLTFWNEAGAIGLWIAVAIAWCGAIFLALDRKGDRRRSISDLLAFGAGAAVVPAWAILFPTHTAHHAIFMSRILILPIALGVTGLLCQVFCMGSTPATVDQIKTAGRAAKALRKYHSLVTPVERERSAP